MTTRLYSMRLESEHDIVAARRKSRDASAGLGFSSQDQTRIATSVLEAARTVLLAGTSARADFLVDTDTRPARFVVRFFASAGAGERLRAVRTDDSQAALGLLAAQRLMDECAIAEEADGGTSISLAKALPDNAPFDATSARSVADTLSASTDVDSTAELQRQNRELIGALADLRERQEELTHLTRELEDTNRGVVALYAELDARADHLRRADESKSRFLSNMSHEFRTPLSSIRALSKLLLERIDGELTEEQEKQVRFIRRAAEDLSETVDDLLDLAKIEAGKIDVRPVEFEVDTLFSALRGMLRPLSPGGAVDLIFDSCVGLPPIRTDEAKVAQVLRNFVSNALKFTERGEVRVSASYDEARRLITFAVADTGIGIAAEHQHVVFEEFGQVENRLQQYVKGTGLGLPLCRKLCKLLGGDVSLTSEPGRGSTFSATMPAYYGDEHDIAHTEHSAADDPRPMVLVVASNPIERLDCEAALRQSPYRAMTAATLDEATRALTRTPPAALLLTVRPAPVEAWTWLAALRAQAAMRNLPIVVLGEAEDRGEAEALGAAAFIGKPVAGSELASVLAAVTDAHRAYGTES
ncbi:ATP-binding protein [Caballeronia sp. LP006]|uniref:ATP-binding response regulator n=1 Tax=unclassified Caballeronia TaxID=2646786 RepID=UPI002866D59B|nr:MULTISPECIES: ATP-binding protein [unclassified Caballeronia]MDR5775109.1 ATP-binding protein [Caballeronia sp. LZ002]MDR5828255.1 ATP-binding protein [Caballeronia sp. LP006]MDR5850547.1 ATP-binding protein [Caballeronia sp. LZ003]